MGLFRKSKSVQEDNEENKGFMKELTGNRKCRDVICIPLFLAYWGGMLFVLVVALQKGDPARLLFGTDYLGNNCGSTSTSDEVECYENETCGIYVSYPKLDEDLYLAFESGYMNTPTGILEYPFHSICRNSCPEGVQDVNSDGVLDNWVCNYDVMAAINTQYGENAVNPQIPSPDARLALEECLEEKGNVPFMSGYSLLPRSKTLSNGQVADCLQLMTGCWKIYSDEQSLFFRCVPMVFDNATCTVSPYLQSINQSVSHIVNEDGTISNRPATDVHCGICLQPENDADGNPTDPSSTVCKARKVLSVVEHTESKVNPLFSAVSTLSQEIQGALADVYNTWQQIVICGAAIPFLLGIVWLIFLRLAAKTFVFTVLYGLLIFLGFLTIQFMIYGEIITADFLDGIISQVTNATGLEIDSNSISTAVTGADLFETETADTTGTYEILGWVFLGITIIYFFLLLVLRKRIKIAVAIIKEATVAISSMPFILFFPTFTVAATLALGGFMAYLSLYIVSMKDIQVLDSTSIVNGSTSALQIYATAARLDSGVDDSISNLTDTVLAQLVDLPTLEIFMLYTLLGYFWTNQLIEAIGSTTIAGAIGSWYWSTSEDNQKSKKLPRGPITKSVVRVFRYHIGSLLFGSLIIALVQIVRTVLMYVDKNTKHLQNKNKAIKFLMKGVQCCLCVLEKCLKFLTKSVYIYIALFGKSFCTASKDVFSLMVRNFARIGTATAISNLIIGIGRVLVVTVSCFMCITILTFSGEGALGDAISMISMNAENIAPSSVVPSVIVTGLLAWFVSGCFMSVYGLTIDTILISFCVDEDKNDGTADRPYYMTKSLKKLTNKINKKSKRVHAEPDSENTTSGKSK